MAEVELPNPKELHEQAEDRFGRRVALVTAVFAVILSTSSMGGNNATKEMLLAQQKSSDQWSFYQAKVIREHLYRAQKQRLETDLIERGPALPPAAREKVEALAKKWDEEEKRYNAEKKDIEKDANVMSSVSILSKSRPVFYFSLLLAVAGTTFTVNGYLLFFQLPWLHEGH